MRSIFAAVGTLVAAAAVGCASSSHEARAHEATASTSSGMQASAAPPPAAAGGQPSMGPETGVRCPMEVPGANARAEDTADGASIVFNTSDPAQVSELRSRVGAIAEHHQRMASRCPCMQGGTGGAGAGVGGSASCPMCGGQSEEMRDAEMGPMHAVMKSNVRAEDVPGGARLVFTPRDPADLQPLRQATRMQAQQLNTGTCPFMGPGMHHGMGQGQGGTGAGGPPPGR